MEGEYIPSTPFGDIEELFFEEKEKVVRYKGFRLISASLVLILIFFGLLSTAISIVLGFTVGRLYIVSIFIPYILTQIGLFGTQLEIFTIAIIVESTIVIFSIAYTIIHKTIGIINDIKREGSELLSFSEFYLMSFALSLIIVMLIPIKTDIMIPIVYAHRIILGAPFWEEFSFRFLGLIFPIWIILRIIKNSDIGFKDIALNGIDKVGVMELGLVIANATAFGLMHHVMIIINLNSILFGEGKLFSIELNWPIEKIPQSVVIGIILGYLAVRYGLPTAITLHWMFNSASFLYPLLQVVLGGSFNLTVLQYIIVGIFTLTFILGIVAMVVFILRIIKR